MKPYYEAVFEDVCERVCDRSRIPVYLRAKIVEVCGGERRTVYTPDDGWLIERPTDDELCGIESFSVPSTDLDAVKKIIELSLDNPDAARAAIAAMEG